MPPRCVAILPVGCGRYAARGRAMGDAAAWYDKVSLGRWRPDFVELPPVSLPSPVARYAARGGMAAQEPNSRTLLKDALSALSGAARDKLAETGGTVMLITPPGIAPHVWYPARGGLPLGRGAWCRRFAVLPHDAPRGTVAHEIGHLLLGWPDGDGSAGAHCLMALGGLQRDLAPPAAPLLLASGWREALPLDATTTIAALACQPGAVGVYGPGGGEIVTEIRGTRLLAWSGPKDRPALVCNFDVTGRGTEPVLGVLGPHLRRLREAVQGIA